MAYQFDWDDEKAADNLLKHGVSFEEAVEVFHDSLAIEMSDPAHSAEESRRLAIGVSGDFRLIVVAYVERPPHTRIITARLATKSERRTYEEE
jgi:uncharacterized DUF497 family protein